ncbi:MAG TPA: hypothetical protein VGJ32_10170 [Solirubrobacteraceae bacterium]
MIFRRQPAEGEGAQLVGRRAERAGVGALGHAQGDLRRAVAGVGDQAVVRGDEPLVEDRAEGRRDLLARPRDVGGDLAGLVDYLVLEARVELHVARLVDLLGGEERRLLLAVVGPHEAGELGRDALFGDHQRAEDEGHERAILHRPPLLAIEREVDRERAPVGVFPAGGRASADRADALRTRPRSRP